MAPVHMPKSELAAHSLLRENHSLLAQKRFAVPQSICESAFNPLESRCEIAAQMAKTAENDPKSGKFADIFPVGSEFARSKFGESCPILSIGRTLPAPA